MDDALHFLNRVKDVFWDQMEKYDMLLQILKDYKDERYRLSPSSAYLCNDFQKCSLIFLFRFIQDYLCCCGCKGGGVTERAPHSDFEIQQFLAKGA